MMTIKQRNKKYKSIINMRSDLDKIKKKQQIILRKTIIIIATIIFLNGFPIPANCQENSNSINKTQIINISLNNKNILLKNFNETRLLKRILIGIIPILIGMSSMTLFTFLLTFLNQYSINRLVNLRKTLQDDAGSLEKKNRLHT